MNANSGPRASKAPLPPVAEILEVRTLLSGSSAEGVFTGWPDFGPGVSASGPVVVADLNLDGRPDVLMSGGNNNLAVLPGAGDGTFLAAVLIPLGAAPEALAVGDVNGDGRPDVIAATMAANEQISVLLGHGDGTFDAPQTFTLSLFTWFGVRTLAVADINGDGHADILAGLQGLNGVGVSLGHGDGTFDTMLSTTVANRGATALAVADFNGDGKPDVAALAADANVVGVLFNSGEASGRLDNLQTYPVDALTYGLAVGDMDGNSTADLVVGSGNGAGRLAVLPNDGHGTFGTPVYSPMDTWTNGLALGDVNGDGHLDAVGTGNGCAVVALGTGSGSFGVRRTFTAADTPSGVVLADLNGDAKLDILLPSNNSVAQVAVLMGAGDGTFGPVPILAVPGQPKAVVIGDFNDDGNWDLVTANPGLDSVSIVLGAGGGRLGVQTDFRTGIHPVDVAVGDFNGDNEFDVVTANSASGDVTVLLGVGDGTLGEPRGFAAGNGPSSVAVGDFNGDGKHDIVVANSTDNTVSVLLGDGNGGFAPAVTFSVGTAPSAVAVGDMNNDTFVDIVTANYGSNNVSVLLGNGSGGFAGAATFPTGRLPASISLGDVDKDGNRDVVTADLSGSTGQVSVLRGLGGGNLAAAANYSITSVPDSAAIGDVNDDGWPDIVAVSDTSATLHVLTNKGDGTFNAETNPPLDTGRTNVILGDLNGDGELDVISTGSTGSGNDDILVLLGSGDATFRASSSMPAQVSGQYVFLDDVDHDGHADLTTVAPATGDVQVRLGTGGGTFGTAAPYSLGSSLDGVQMADLNGGGPEIIATSQAGKYVAILWNDGTGHFAAAAKTTVGDVDGDGPVDLAVGDVDGGGPDIVTANFNAKTLTLLHNAGAAFTQTTVKLDSYPGALAVGDVTGDGNADIVIWMSYSIRVYPGNGAGAFSAHTDYPAIPTASRIFLVDLNADGHTDIAYIDGGGDVTVFLSNGAGGFGTPKTTSISGTGNGRLADINGDGKLDAVVPNSSGTTVAVALGLGDGTFGTPQYCSTADGPNDVAVADINEDGRLDAMTISRMSGRAGILMNNGWGLLGTNFQAAGLTSRASEVQLVDTNGDGRSEIAAWDQPSHNFMIATAGAGNAFAMPQSSSPRETMTHEVLGDVTGDSRPDLVGIDDGYRVFVVPQEADGRYRNMLYLDQSATSHGQTALAVGDVTGDGAGDIVVAETAPTPFVAVRAGAGLGAFRAPVRYALPTAPSEVVLADVNGDGRKDVVVLSASGNAVYVLLQGADGTLGSPATYATGSAPSGLTVADITGDGVGDVLVVIAADSVVEVRPGSAGGTFGAVTRIPVIAAPQGLAVANVTGDSTPDLLTWSGSQVAVQPGLGGGALGPAVMFRAARTITDLAVGDVTADGAADLVLAEADRIEVRPNLKPWTEHAELSAPAGATQVWAQTGQAVTVVVPVANAGTAAAGNFTVALHQSPDAAVDGADPVVGTATCQWLAVGGLAGQAVTFTAPATPGTYYLRAQADSGGAIAETNKADNWGQVITLTVSDGPPQVPDLTITAPAAGTRSAHTGQQVSVDVRVDNIGTAAAGAFSAGLYLSLDATVTTADQRVGGFDLTGLAAGGNHTQTVIFGAPATAQTYYLAAIADTGAAVAETNEANNTGQTVTLSVTVAPPGIDVALNGTTAKKVRFHEADGTTVTVGLTGKDTAVVHLSGTNVSAAAPAGGVVVVTATSNQVQLDSITVTGNDTRGALTVTTAETRTSAPGTSLGSLAINGSLGSVAAATTALRGDAKVTGTLGTLTLGDVADPHLIEIDGALAGGMTITLGRVRGLTLTSASVLKGLTVTDWLAATSPVGPAGSVSAPEIQSLTVKGNSKVGAAGDFQANVVTTTPNAKTGVSLNTVSIAGGLGAADWDIDGKIGTVTVRGNVAGWNLHSAAHLLAGVTTLTLSGVSDSTVSVDGPLATLKMKKWTGGAVAATTITSLTTTADRTGPMDGSFTGNLTLTGNPSPRLSTLGSATIAGGVAGTAWLISGSTGAVTINGVAENWTLQGAGANGAGLAAVKSLTLGDARTVTVLAGGALGAVKALNWAGGGITADSMASLAVTGRKLTPTAGALAGSFGASVTLHGANLAPRKPAAGAVSIAADLNASQWLVTGSMTTLAVAGTALNSTVRASGSITSITLGAGNGSKFLAGVKTAQLDPAAVTSADLEPMHLATIGSVTVKGWSTTGTPPAFLTACSFLAPCLGTVRLLNADLATSGLYALAGPTVARIKTVTLKDTRFPNDPVHNWTWTAVTNKPPNAGGVAKEIP